MKNILKLKDQNNACKILNQLSFVNTLRHLQLESVKFSNICIYLFYLGIPVLHALILMRINQPRNVCKNIILFGCLHIHTKMVYILIHLRCQLPALVTFMALQNITGKNLIVQWNETNLTPQVRIILIRLNHFNKYKLDVILFLGMAMDMESHRFTTVLQHQSHFTEIPPPCHHYQASLHCLPVMVHSSVPEIK